MVLLAGRGLVYGKGRNPKIRNSLPMAIFKPRTHLVKHVDGGLLLNQLGRDFSLQDPVDWMLAKIPHTHLERLALHYHEFLEAVPYEDGLRLILSWIEANPPWLPGYWLDRWNSYAVSIRCVCWMQWIAKHRGLLSEHDIEKIVSSLYRQVQFLVSNLETDICGNHLIKNIRCLMWAAAFFDGRESDQWSQLATDLLRWQLPIQFLDDGMHFELSPAYHCQVFGDLIECTAVARSQQKDALLNCLSRASQVAADMTHPDGLISLMSDGGLHMAYSPDECLRVFEVVGGIRPVRRQHFAFHSSGYYGFRSRRTYLLADCGPVCADALPAHGHADILALEWDVDGQRFLVDAGVLQYESGEERARMRSVVSHNTVQVGTQDQAEFVGSFRVGRRSFGVCDLHESSSTQMVLAGHHDGFSTKQGKITHRRLINAKDECLHVKDSIEGSSSEEVVSRLLLHDECIVVACTGNNIEFLRGNTRVRFFANVSFRIVDSRWSPDFGVSMPTKCIELLLGPSPCRCEFRLDVL